jgi:DNA-binding winged helix-turn-helix (wHTH) protein
MSAIMLEPPSPFLGPEPPRKPRGKTAPTEDQQDDRPREPDRPPRNDRHLARGFRMADCIVRPDRGSIARPGEDAEFVEPKLMEVLLHLAVADGELVERRELLDAHWHRGAECDGALTRVICALRRALGDDSRHPRSIGTVHKHGYRLLVHPEPLAEEDPGDASSPPVVSDRPLTVSAHGTDSDARGGLLGELKRRRVIRVGTAYAVAGWLIVQVAETTFEPLGVPDWGLTLLVLFVALGFPLAVVLAWAVQLTPDGPVLEMQVAGISTGQRAKAARGLPLVVAAAVLAAVVVLGYQFTRTMVPSATTYSCPVDEEYPVIGQTEPRE